MDDEKQVERYLCRCVRRIGGRAYKWTSPGCCGVPDRLVFFPGGGIVPVELKAPGMKPRPLQLKRKRMLERLGFPVYVVDNIEQIGGILDEIQST